MGPAELVDDGTGGPPAGAAGGRASSSVGRPGVRPATPAVVPVVVLAVVLAVVGLVIDLAALEGVSAWLPDVVVGWAFLVCAVLLHGAGAGRMALLLVLCAVCWFAGALDPALALVHRGPLVHLLLAYPTGRLTGPARVVVPGAYLVGVLPGAWGDEVVTCGLAPLLVLTVEVQRRSVGGPMRRARGQALVVAVGAAAVLVGSAAARLLLPEGDADRWTLWVYEAGLVGAAALTTRSVLRRTWRVRPVTDLVVRVGQDRSRTVRDALAAEIGDPTLEIGYRSGDGFVDVAGRSVELPAAGTGRAATSVVRAGSPVAVLVHDEVLLADPALVEAVAATARLAQHNADLRRAVEAQLVDLEASRRRLVEVGDAERARLARLLDEDTVRHLDELQQRLARADAAAGDEVAAEVRRARRQLDRTLQDLAVLAAGLDPVGVQAGGLEAALRDLADRCPLPVAVTWTGPRPTDEVATTTWFVCSEAVANAVKHSGATRVVVRVDVGPATVRTSVQDDGAGGADPSRGSGLRGVTDRVEAVGGRVRVTSPAGGGTVVEATLPSAPPSARLIRAGARASPTPGT